MVKIRARLRVRIRIRVKNIILGLDLYLCWDEVPFINGHVCLHFKGFLTVHFSGLITVLHGR